MAKLDIRLAKAKRQCEYCIDRVEFYKTKSSRKNAKEWANHFQFWADFWADLVDLLEELKYIKTAFPDEQKGENLQDNCL